VFQVLSQKTNLGVHIGKMDFQFRLVLWERARVYQYVTHRTPE
jgi:hypothetical protein